MFSAVEPRNGCSTVCAEVAISLANQTSGAVCIVDANFRSPSQHFFFGVDNSRGLTDAIRRRRSVKTYAQHLGPHNVWVLTSGMRPLRDLQLPIDRYTVERVISEISAAFDYVFINAPLVNPFLDVTFKDHLAWCLRDVSLANMSPKIYRVPLGAGSTREDERKVLSRMCGAQRSPAYRAALFSGERGGVNRAAFCARTAVSFAEQTEGSVCVLDADFYSPSLHRFFGLENSDGLLQAFFQGDAVTSFAQPLSIRNLWVLPAGSVVRRFDDGVSWDRLKRILIDLRSEFDYVLIDGPPVDSCPETALLGQLADGVVMVMEANATRREVARQAKRSLEAASSRLLAVVLNKRTFPIPDSIYEVFCRRPARRYSL